MPLLIDYAQYKKFRHFFTDLPKDVKILEVGAGSGWLGRRLKKAGWHQYFSLDITPPADLLGDIKAWKAMNITPGSFDVIVAFEFVEHIDAYREFHDILKPGGMLFLSTPVPHMDWMCRLLEFIGLNQKRTSPHVNLHYLQEISLFDAVDLTIIGFLAQWGKFRKPFD